MEKTLHILELTPDEERIAKEWAKAYGCTIEELFNVMLNKLETSRYDLIAALGRELRANLTLD